MRRRAFLAAAAGGATAPTAGCLAGGEPFLVVSDFGATWSRIDGESTMLRFDAHPTDDEVTEDDPGTFTLALSNLTRREVTVLDGAVPPFGVLFAVRAAGAGTATPDADGDGERFLLWGEYGDCVRVDDGAVAVCERRGQLGIEGGGTVRRTYDLRAGTANLEPGRYLVESRVEYEAGGERGALAYAIRFALRERR